MLERSGNRTNYILIDYENLQPASLAVFANGPFKVRTFLGAQQAKLSSEFASEMQKLGNRAEYVRISGSGRNALDLHISFYIGEISAKDQNVFFHIISKDKGFDPLVDHLKRRKIYARRSECLSEIPLLQSFEEMSEREKYDATVRRLIGLKDSKPKTLKTLTSTIHALFHRRMNDCEVASLVQSLRSRKSIEVAGKEIRYHLDE